jgi:beta-glucosidase/6-phospho-beta-glucosidase/beta-galactosidase
MALFESFFIGGFECSTHYGPHGRRLDLLAATRHDRFAALDYARLHEAGIYTIREGIRWHRIETAPGHYSFADTVDLVRTAEQMRMQVIWDLLHFGYPDDLDPFHLSFIKRFAAFAREFIHVLKNESDSLPFITPINEISFLAYQGGEVASINPFSHGRGHALKIQLVRATIEAMEAIWEVAPQARFVLVDPLFNAVAEDEDPQQIARARAYSHARYEAWDMLAGKVHPELGGQPKYLDLIGVDYYPWNQWIYINDYEAGRSLRRGDPRYIPLHQLLAEVYERYHRPLLISETSAEDGKRTDWLTYVSEQARLALQSGVPLEGLCWYPIVDYPGWDNDRACHTGLWGVCDENGSRPVHEPLTRELAHQSAAIEKVHRSLFLSLPEGD